MTIKHFIKKHRIKFFFIIIPVIIVAFIFWPKGSKNIETHTVKNGEIVESLAATGTIDSVTSVNLNFLSGGKLVYLGARKGDIVEAGQVIATLDQRTTQKNLETALRNYALQRNTFEQTKDDQNDHTPQDAINDEMKRILESSQYDLEKAVISVELQQLAKEQSVLTTPIGGIVIRADATAVGLNVTATHTFTIADPSNLIFKMDIDEADIGKIRQGQTVHVTLDAFPEQPLELSVNAIDFATHVTATGGNAYTVEAILPTESSLTYRLGMNGDAEITVNKKIDILTVPLASIIDDKYVYVKTEKGFEKRKVTLGLTSDTDTEVLSGLSKGEEVALNPEDAEKESKKKRFL